MRLFLSMIFSLLLAVFCDDQITNTAFSNDQIVFTTDKQSYNNPDSIIINLKNESDSTLIIGLRCGAMLEMYYQVLGENTWSDNILFGYMTLGCPTIMDSVESKEQYSQSVPTSIFESPGTFRLVLNEKIVSNCFTIN